MQRFSKPSLKSDVDMKTRFLYVAGIGDQLQTPLDKIQAVFGVYGEIEEIEFVKNKRFCFICYSSIDSAIEARYKLSDTDIPVLGGKVYIKFAEETQPREAVPEPECTSITNDEEVPGLELFAEFISIGEESVILNDSNAGQNSSLWKESISRRVQHYGFTFNYRTLMLDYDTRETPPIPSLYSNISETIQPNLTQLTLNEYYPGQGIAPHIDTETCFGPEIFIVSLQSGVTMTLIQQKPTSRDTLINSECNKRKKHVYLPPRSLLVLKGDARYSWSHSIAPRKYDKVDGTLIPRGRRVSLTFRQALVLGDIPSSKLVNSFVEQEHVFRVYDSIALHWHHTRGRRKVHWHRVKAFIETLPSGSLIADVGSGDGKYFGLAANSYTIGCDRSMKLLEVSKDSNNETFCCDAVKLPLRSNIFDAVLCIAVLHHLASVDRRAAVIRELMRICRPGGSVMLQAWALEQEEGSKRLFEEQDVLVPWRLQKHFQSPAEGEGTIVSPEDTFLPEGPCTHVVEEKGELVFQRYCHVYRAGELEDLCSSVPGCCILESGFDRSNWFVLFEKQIDDRVAFIQSSVGPISALPQLSSRNK